MNLIESCNQIGLEINPQLSREEIIDELTVHSKDRKDVQLILGVALQETGRFKEAFDVFCELADNGSVAGKFQKATYLYDGNNVEKDQKAAIKLMDEVMAIAKEEGLTELYRSSAECLARHSFHFFPQNNKDAEAYWIQAASDGDGSVQAMVDLGKYYYSNENYQDAFYWYQCATGRGHAHSQACIGIMYWRGLGIDKNFPNALSCLKGAAEKGNNYARGYLAELQYKLKLFTEAALSGKTVYDSYKTDDGEFITETEQEGLAIGTFILGRCLMTGRGASRDQPTGQQLIEFSLSVNKKIATRLHNEWLKGII